MSIFSAYAQQKITKNYAVALAERIEELNAALGEAIESILGGEMGMAMEPPNPIMGIVAQILSNSLEKPLTTPIQGEDGKFVKKIVEKIS
tara:strand:+ start:2574 stop:2843 length:270 start_codon:yes stop_codon:yes gene_type:complete